jgi:L-threonylcarbamoyladenylate synthase
VQVRTHSVSNPQAPGLLSSHYAPRTPLIIGDVEKLISKYANENIAILTLNQTFCQIDERRQLQLSQNGDLQEAATNLFSYLRFLDGAGYTYILSELLPDTGLGRAINDRLRRAAAIPVHYVTS